MPEMIIFFMVLWTINAIRHRSFTAVSLLLKHDVIWTLDIMNTFPINEGTREIFNGSNAMVRELNNERLEKIIGILTIYTLGL